MCVLLRCSIYPYCQLSSIYISIGYSIVIASAYGTESYIITVALRRARDARQTGRAAASIKGIDSRAGDQRVLQAAQEH